MGMLDRFTDIIKANVNDLLDRAEDPSKMVDQYLRDLTESSKSFTFASPVRRSRRAMKTMLERSWQRNSSS